MRAFGIDARAFGLPIRVIVISVLCFAHIFLNLGMRDAVAQESCANLQHQLSVLRSSGGAGSQWDAFIQQRMRQLGCFGGQSQSSPRCPADTEYCPRFNLCCGSGNFCSVYGCIQRGSIECGGYSCSPGNQCSRGGGCVPEGKVDCGGGHYCEEDNVCWTASADIPGVVRRGEKKCTSADNAQRLDEKIAEILQEKKLEAELAVARRKREREEAQTRERWQKLAEKQQEEAALKLKQEEQRKAIQEKQDAIRRKEEARKAEIERKRMVEAEAKAAAAKAAADRTAAAKAAAERAAAEKAAVIKAAADKAAADRLNAQAAADRAAAEKIAAKAAADKAAADRIAAANTAANPNNRPAPDLRAGQQAIDKAFSPEAQKVIDANPNARRPPDLRAGQQAIDRAFSPEAQKVIDANPNVRPPPDLRAGQQAIDRAFSPEAQKVIDANPNVRPPPDLRAGQQTIDRAFSPEAQKVIDASPNVRPPPDLRAGQQAIDRAFSPEANTNNSPPAMLGTGQQTAAAPVNRSLSVARADDYLRTVTNDFGRPQRERDTAARALNDTPASRELAAIELGKPPEPSGRPAAAAPPPIAPPAASAINVLKDTADKAAAEKLAAKAAADRAAAEKIAAAKSAAEKAAVEKAAADKSGADRIAAAKAAAEQAAADRAAADKVAAAKAAADRIAAARPSAEKAGPEKITQKPITVIAPGTPATLASQTATRQQLWPRMGVPSMTSPLPINKEKLKYDWVSLQLANAAYNDKLTPGSTVFKNNPDWKVLDRRDDKATGFTAFTFVNIKEHRMVVAVRGSASLTCLVVAPICPADKVRDARADWKGNADAMVYGNISPQFLNAEKYVSDIKTRFGDRFAIDCSGHSQGGGACAYAASQNQGIHAVTINPTSANNLATDNAYMIDNYVVGGEVALGGRQFMDKGLTGWAYNVEASRAQGPLVTSNANSTPQTADPLGDNAIARHSPGGAIDILGRELGLAPFELAQ